MNEKKPRKDDDAQLAIVRQLRPIDDVFFEVMMEDSDACEELLQVVLENPLLRIKKKPHVQELYVIYIADFDVFENGRTISHAEMTCQETGIPVNDGLHEVFVTTVGSDDSKVARLMREYKNPDMNNPEFPKQSKRVQEMKHSEKEAGVMCTLVKNYAEERAKKERLYCICKMLAKGYAKNDILDLDYTEEIAEAEQSMLTSV